MELNSRLCDNLEGLDRERDRRASERKGHMYTCGCFMLLYAEINTILQSIILQVKMQIGKLGSKINIKSIIKYNITYDKVNVHHNKKRLTNKTKESLAYMHLTTELQDTLKLTLRSKSIKTQI